MAEVNFRRRSPRVASPARPLLRPWFWLAAFLHALSLLLPLDVRGEPDAPAVPVGPNGAGVGAVRPAALEEARILEAMTQAEGVSLALVTDPEGANQAVVVQSGTSNRGVVSQTGEGNEVTLVQEGVGHDARIVQVGVDLQIVVMQLGAGGLVTVTQGF